MYDIRDAVMFIVDGRGRGQYRRVLENTGRRVKLESPWKIEPGPDSLVAIGVFNGRHLIIGNTFTDTGSAVQLYPPNYECIVAENRSARTSNFNCLSKLRTESHNSFIRFEPADGEVLRFLSPDGILVRQRARTTRRSPLLESPTISCDQSVNARFKWR